MSSQQPQQPQQYGSGGRGGGRGGRGGGRGGGGGMHYNSYPNQQPQQQQQRPMSAWQPAAPTSLQQQQQQQYAQSRQGGGRGTGGAPHSMGGRSGYHPGGRGGGAPQAYYNPYGPGGAVYPPQTWQGGAAAAGGMPYANMRGGVFYPPPQATAATAAGGQASSASSVSSSSTATPSYQPPAPRVKKPLVITDKQGNVIDLSSSAPPKKAAAAATTPTATTPTSTATKSTVESASPASAAGSSMDAGAKLHQAALAQLEKDNAEKTKVEEEQTAAKKKEEEEAAKKKKEEEAAAKKEHEEGELARKAAETKRKDDEAAAKKAKEEQNANGQAPARSPTSSVRKSLAELLIEDKPAPAAARSSGRIVFSKEALFRLRNEDLIRERPDDLPEIAIFRGQQTRGKSGGGRQGSSRGGGGDGGEWSRGSAPPRRQSSTGDQQGGGGGQWTRGQAPPKPQNRGGRQRSGRGGPQQPFYDGPVAPLVKSENHWRPTKNTSAFVVAEKQVKSILNKMTKEKFDRLSAQMIAIPITSSETLSMMIKNVFDKAIDEPSFGDMYADLCVKLSRSAQVSNFVHVIESDEEPPTEDGVAAESSGASSSHTVYRWSNDVSTSDSEVVGPFDSEDACYDVALSEEEESPVERGDMNLELVSVSIRCGIFVKIMKKKDAEEGEEGIYYTVYFPVNEAEECGQQLSDIFLSKVECVSDANKKNSFKSSLLNKCEEEFNKQDIYVDWKEEKKAYEEGKGSMTESERAEKAEDLDFRRIRIKKQMLGNVKFIGQLYKKSLLKEKIIRYCIGSLLKLEGTGTNSKVPEYQDGGDTDMDEEDHEAMCSIFTTIGSTIDTPGAANFMNVCFTKIEQLSTDKSLPARSRFMYKDLLDLRANKWVPRRKVEKAKTLEEIRKDVEREERRQAQLSQSMRGGGRGDYGSRSGGRGDNRGRQSHSGGNRGRPAKQAVETDEDGFTKIATRSNFSPTKGQTPKSIQTRNTPVQTKQGFSALEDDARGSTASKPAPAALSADMLERRIKSMRSDFMNDGGNVDELMLSFDELSGTPEAGRTLVSKNADHSMECKDAERDAIVKILSILFEKGKLTKEDVSGGLVDIIEFIDSMVLDSPKAYEYLGQILGAMLRVGAITVGWVCEQVEKTKVDPKTPAPEKIITATLSWLKNAGGSEAVDATVRDAGTALEKLLGPDKWRSMSQAL